MCDVSLALQCAAECGRVGRTAWQGVGVHLWVIQDAFESFREAGKGVTARRKLLKMISVEIRFCQYKRIVPENTQIKVNLGRYSAVCRDSRKEVAILIRIAKDQRDSKILPVSIDNAGRPPEMYNMVVRRSESMYLGFSTRRYRDKGYIIYVK